MKCVRYYSQILIKLEAYRHSFEKKKNRQIEFNENLSSGTLVVPHREERTVKQR